MGQLFLTTNYNVRFCKSQYPALKNSNHYARFTLGCNHDLTKWLDRSLTDWNHEILVAVGSHRLDDFSGRPDFWFDRWLHGPKKYDSGDKNLSWLHRPMWPNQVINGYKGIHTSPRRFQWVRAGNKTPTSQQNSMPCTHAANCLSRQI